MLVEIVFIDFSTLSSFWQPLGQSLIYTTKRLNYQPSRCRSCPPLAACPVLHLAHRPVSRRQKVSNGTRPEVFLLKNPLLKFPKQRIFIKKSVVKIPETTDFY
jgi:hypothetical protein